MRIILLPSSVSGKEQDQFLTSFLVNDTIAIDAGSLGFHGSPVQQARVRHVIITHTHVDHVASLPIFVENIFQGRSDCVTIHASAATLEGLQGDIFNNRAWPDFVAFSRPPAAAPFLRLECLEPGRPLVLDGLRITPVPVDHVVPTLGLVLEEPGTTVVVPSDTAPTDAIWNAARGLPDLKAVFLEAAFPNSMETLAIVSKHLTPAMFAGEVRKMPAGIRFLAVHIKPRFFDQIAAELAALGLPEVEICRPGHTYEF
jgi:ribonuclease BN (tRNA processing enzyme)